MIKLENGSVTSRHKAHPRANNTNTIAVEPSVVNLTYVCWGGGQMSLLEPNPKFTQLQKKCCPSHTEGLQLIR